MDSVLALGCVLVKSSSTLHMTSDPRERKAAAIFIAVFGALCLVTVLLVPFPRLGWAGVAVFGCAGTACLLLAFLTWQCWTELEFDIPQGQIVRRRLCLGRVRSVSLLPLGQLKTVRAFENKQGVGELQLIRTDGRVWAKWLFLASPMAEEAQREILTWLREHSE